MQSGTPRTHERRFRLRWVDVLSSVVAGMTLTVGVAWWLSLRDVLTELANHSAIIEVRRDGPEASTDVVVVEAIARDGFRAYALRTHRHSQAHISRLIAERVRLSIQTEPVPSFGNLHPGTAAAYPQWLGVPQSSDSDRDVWGARAVGWPMLAMYSRFDRLRGGSERSIGSVRVLAAASYSVLTANDPERGRIPLIPLWPGFAVNTAAFGAAAFVLITLARGTLSLIRRSRRRASRCPHCGYDLRGSPPDRPCPECGRTADGQAAASAIDNPMHN